MNLPDLDAFLSRSLADFALSKGERSALADWLAANARTDQHRGVVRHQLFEAAKAASASLDAARLLDWLEDALKVVAPPTAAPAAAAEPASVNFSPGDACLGQIVHRFSFARTSADVCVFTVTDDRITRALLDAHRRGVRVRLITDNDKAFDLGSDVQRIQQAGVPVRVDRTQYHMHHKFAVFDGARLLNGSYNWTRGAAEQNEENLIDTGDPVLVAAFAREFGRLWDALGE